MTTDGGIGRANPSCAVLVLNWNGLTHLRALLPTLTAAAGRYPGMVRIVIVDNRSTEPDVDVVRSEFPGIEVVVSERNDYLFSLNPVVRACAESIVIILNNDMRVDPDFIAPLVRHFADPAVFAATANVFDWAGTQRTTGQRRMALRRWWFYKWWDLSVTRAVYTLDAGGGCAAFHRGRFVALGGFDPLYRPAYYEDIDLSYRAWMRGWRTVFEPESIIYHREGATLRDPAREGGFRARLARNHVLFTVKNVGGWGFLMGFLAMAPVRVVASYLRGDRSTARGILAAVPRLGLAVLGRWRGMPHASFGPAAIAAASAAPLDTIAA